MAIDLSIENVLTWQAEGRIFQVQHGSLTTPAAFETDLVRKTADLAIRVPAGTVIVPIRATVETEATGAAVFQCLVSTSNNDPGTDNHTKATPNNANSKYANDGSACTAYITATSTGFGTAPTGIADVLRVYVQPDIDAITEAATFEQVVYDPLAGRGCPAIVGDNSNTHAFYVNVGNGTSATGIITATWAEFTYAEFYAA